MHDVGLQGLVGGWRSRFWPKLIEDLIRPYDPIGGGGENGQKAAGHGPNRLGGAVDDDLDGPQ